MFNRQKELLKKLDNIYEKLSAIEKRMIDDENNRKEIFRNVEKEEELIVKGIDKSNKLIMRELSRITVPLERNVDYKIRSIVAIKNLITNYTFDTVLYVGCCEGLQSEFFIKNNKYVTSLDYGNSIYFEKKNDKQNVIIANFNEYTFSEKFDCVWCSHILEHQPNVNSFLKKVFDVAKDNGVIAVTVPPAKHAVVGGHLTMWNAGLLLYNLVFAGFDCSEAEIIEDDYDISVILRKKAVPQNVLDSLSFDSGDIVKIKEYLPSRIDYSLRKSGDLFDGENI